MNIQNKQIGFLYGILGLLVASAPVLTNRNQHPERFLFYTIMYCFVFVILFTMAFVFRTKSQKKVDVYSGSGIIITILVLITEIYFIK